MPAATGRHCRAKGVWLSARHTAQVVPVAGIAESIDSTRYCITPAITPYGIAEGIGPSPPSIAAAVSTVGKTECIKPATCISLANPADAHRYN